MLTQYVSVYVPGTKQTNVKLSARDRSIYTDKIARQLSDKFGGSTATRGIGFYVSNNGELIRENVTIVKSFYAGDSAAAFEFACKLGRQLKTELSQESVTIESNEGIEFV
jgi:hypothetical protein